VGKPVPSAHAESKSFSPIASRSANHPGLVDGVKGIEADIPAELSDGVCGAVEPGRFTVIAGVDGECGEVLEPDESAAVCPHAREEGERVVGVAVGLFGPTLQRRDEHACDQRLRVVGAGRRRNGFVGPSSRQAPVLAPLRRWRVRGRVSMIRSKRRLMTR
jgi:hypothetical protein